MSQGSGIRDHAPPPEPTGPVSAGPWTSSLGVRFPSLAQIVGKGAVSPSATISASPSAPRPGHYPRLRGGKSPRLRTHPRPPTIPESYEYHPSADYLPPDMDTVYYGHDGYRRFWRQCARCVRRRSLGPRGDDRLRSQGLWSRPGRAATDRAAAWPSASRVFQVFTFRGGLVIRQEDFSDRSKALEAAGLSE